MQYQLESAAGIANRILNLVPVEKGTLFVGLDVEKEGAMITVSFNAGAPLILGKDTRENILAVFTEVISRGHSVICVQEACGFGYPSGLGFCAAVSVPTAFLYPGER